MDYTMLAAVLFAVIALYLGVRALAGPLRIVGIFVYKMTTGVVALTLLNFATSWLGLRLPVNPVTSAVAGVLGVPGIGLLFALQRLLVSR
ncbi:MAG: pro-sigmaK processing inhibitor BofA family protein [Bacillota bacterium]